MSTPRMVHCPLCQTAARAKSSRYISKEIKERYHHSHSKSHIQKNRIKERLKDMFFIGRVGGPCWV
ncbi:ogr/Delta-like zinc finger family protein [Pantoea anthophila]|uniref:ogr/Delta-like zinc finger family protein n=1 Tax=Pantoea anthophila TaxID=470931 RepID=UPI003B8A5D40